MADILVVGGGPAGAAAAIAGCLEGASVRLVERATTFRHKVCGEFISPAALEVLEELQVVNNFYERGPSRIRNCILHLANRTTRWKLDQCAWGLSRLQLDRMLIEKASALGATISMGERLNCRRDSPSEERMILACGRTQVSRQRDRLFGFKTHFEGPSNDAVELFFGQAGYVGVSAIEDGLTNVCGIAPESMLRNHEFDFDQFVLLSPALAERLRPMKRQMEWIVTGPLSFGLGPASSMGSNTYEVGDSLTFVDPFTGSGILNALFTGRLAGIAAARRISRSEYIKACHSLLDRPFLISSMLRRFLRHSEFHWLAHYFPGEALFRWTRAKVSRAVGANTPLWSRT